MHRNRTRVVAELTMGVTGREGGLAVGGSGDAAGSGSTSGSGAGEEGGSCLGEVACRRDESCGGEWPGVTWVLGNSLGAGSSTGESLELFRLRPTVGLRRSEDERASEARGCRVSEGTRFVGDPRRAGRDAGECGALPLPSEEVEGFAGLPARGEEGMERTDGVRERLPVRWWPTARATVG